MKYFIKKNLNILILLGTEGKFQFVPKNVFDEAEKYAKESMESDDEEM